MKCNICDRDLNEKEISFNKEIGNFEPCAVCLDVAFDAAFSDGFSRPDDDDSYVIIEEDATPSYESAVTTMFQYLKRGED